MTLVIGAVTKNSLVLSSNTLLLCSCVFSLSLAQSAAAADFSQSKKVYVPATAYERRIDYSSISEQNNLPKSYGAKASPASVAKKGASKTSATAGASKTIAKSSTKTASLKAPSVPAKLAKTAILKEGTLPPPALNGKAASGQSLAEIARSLSAKVPPGAIAKMKQTAASLEKSGKLDEAQRVLTKIAQLNPEDKANLQEVANLSVQRARNYLKTNNFQDAIFAARQALAASPNDPAAHGLLSELYKKVGADPNDITSRLRTAQSLHLQGRHREAEVEYKASLAVKATPEAHAGLGKVAEQMHGVGAGKEHFEKALELDSNHAESHRELGVMHLKKGDVVSANTHLSRALILDPKDKAASDNLLKLWKSQVAKMPNANSHLGLARAHQLSGDLPSAQAEYREVVRLDPKHPYLPAARQSFKLALAKQEADKSFTAAKTLESQGLLRDAYQKAAEASTYAPGNSSYKLFQGELLERLGQPAQARQVYMSVLKDDPQNISAAQKLKVLPEIAAAGVGAAGVASSFLPGPSLTSAFPTNASGHPLGFPGSKFPGTLLAPSAVSGAAGIMAQSAATPAGVAAAASADHVSSLSGFMGDLRNHMLLQNEKNKKLEDTAQKVIKQLTAPPEDEPEAAAPVAGGGAPAAAPSGGGSENLGDAISKLLSGGVAPAAASDSASGSGAISGAASALASAQAALAAAKGQAPATPPAAKSSPASKTASLPPKKESSSSASARLKELEAQNQKLREQLNSLQNSNSAPNLQNFAPNQGQEGVPLYAPQSSAGQFNSAPQFNASQLSAPQFGEALSSQFPPVAPQLGTIPAGANFGSVLPASGMPLDASSLALQNALPGVQAIQGYGSPGLAPPVVDPSSLRGPIATQPVKFELKNIKPTLKDVQLKVALRNDSNNPIAIPADLKAIIKYPNQSESELKIAFDGKMLAPHSSLDGVVKVPFSKVDPNADLILRNLLPGNAELHVNKTAALSQGVPF